jgi:hypothetical protein
VVVRSLNSATAGYYSSPSLVADSYGEGPPRSNGLSGTDAGDNRYGDGSSVGWADEGIEPGDATAF